MNQHNEAIQEFKNRFYSDTIIKNNIVQDSKGNKYKIVSSGNKLILIDLKR